MKKVITYGTYDLLHYGHIKLLERAKELGDYLIVGITSDAYDRTRGKINNQQSLMERIAGVEATGLADEIIVEEYEGQKIDDVRRMGVDIFTVGSDWVGKFDYLKEFCEVVYLPRTEGISSSEIRSENRKLKIGTMGNPGLCQKLVRELEYVNGAEYQECDDSFQDVDAVYIATHSERHFEDVRKALSAGKHVLCESPVAISKEQFAELYELAESKNLILADAIKTAYSTAYSRLLGVAKSGHIGKIVSVDAVCTSLVDGAGDVNADLTQKQNTICGWGPIALLPVLQLLGTDYKDISIVTHLLDEKLNYDGYTKIDLVYDHAVAGIKIGKAAKAEGELVITGTKGYIYVPAPWWKMDYFEVRFENQSENQRYFYQLDGEGIRYEIVAFAKAVESGKHGFLIDNSISLAISEIIEKFYHKEYKRI